MNAKLLHACIATNHARGPVADQMRELLDELEFRTEQEEQEWAAERQARVNDRKENQ